MKQKKKSFLVISIFFAIIFAIGIIGLIMPQNYENFSYSNLEDTIFTENNDDNFDVSFTLNNNSDKSFYDFKVYIKFTSSDVHFNEKDREITLDVDSLEAGESIDLKFSFRKDPDEVGTLYTLGSIKHIEIQTETESITIYPKSILIGPNWYFFGMTVIGFIAGFLCFTLWKTSDKQYKDPVEENIKSFTQRIQESFQPIIENSKPKDERIVCHYCKCKYDGLKHNKCPNCGAPPEHKD